MDQPPTAAVRAWARARGLPVGDRGRLSPDLVAAFVADQRGGAAAAPPPPASGGGTTVRARGPWNWPALEGRPPPTGAPRTRKAAPPAR